MSSQQWHFDFCDWRDAFELFYRRRKENRKLCMIVSTAPNVSGYWVEENLKPDKDTRVYRTVKAVKLLERRVKYAVSRQKGFALGRIVVTLCFLCVLSALTYGQSASKLEAVETRALSASSTLRLNHAPGQTITSYTLKDGSSTLTVRTDGRYAYTKGTAQFFGQVGVETQGDLLLFGESESQPRVFGHVNTATCEMSFRVDLAGVEILTGRCELYKQMTRDLNYRDDSPWSLNAKLSVFAFGTTAALDCLSSNGLHEQNGLLRNAHGGINQGACFAINGGALLGSVLLQKKWPRMMNWIRWGGAVGHGAAFARNETVKQ